AESMMNTTRADARGFSADGIARASRTGKAGPARAEGGTRAASGYALAGRPPLAGPRCAATDPVSGAGARASRRRARLPRRRLRLPHRPRRGAGRALVELSRPRRL